MDKSLDAETESRAAIQRLLAQHQSLTAELIALTRELDGVLHDLQGHVVPSAPFEVQSPPLDGLPKHPTQSPVEIQKEAELALRRGMDAMRESASARQRSRHFRTSRRGISLDGAGSPPAGGAVKEIQTLSKREQEVLHLMVKGKTSKQIAAELGISFKTAVTHRASIMGKLDVHEVASVVREAILRGLV